jgi:hypothetical protein
MANSDVPTGTSPLRRRTLTAHNEATMRTVVDIGEAGRLVPANPLAAAQPELLPVVAEYPGANARSAGRASGCMEPRVPGDMGSS